MIIPIANQYSYDQIPRNRDLKHTITNHCYMPSTTLLVDWKGDCFVCDCEAWLPVSVGKITDFARLEDVWTSPAAAEIQQDIQERKYSHCAVERCGIMSRSIGSSTRYTVSINIDESCNLYCPSCRKEKIMITSGPVYEEKLAQVNHLVLLLEQFDHPTKIIMSGNGDVMASSIMRPLLHRFRPRKNQQIKLFTNGLLLRKQLTDNPVMNHVKEYLLSIDAGSKQVYEQVRLGGKWENLLDNLDFLREHQLGRQVALTFVVQKNNYKDMKNFAELCIQYGFSGGFTKLEDWGTWQNFIDHNVLGNIEHAEHQDAIQNLQTIYKSYASRIQFDTGLIQLVQS
jgi:molybdenum cofactor biosynthesis enzyme MoaA